MQGHTGHGSRMLFSRTHTVGYYRLDRDRPWVTRGAAARLAMILKAEKERGLNGCPC